MLKAIDFFCGAGGLTRGLLDAGVEVVGGFDSNAACHTTYERNNTPARFLHRKIEDVNALDLRRLLGSVSPDRVLFAGCAPCQPFTKQRRDGDYSQQRTLLGTSLALS
ncbi:MAG: DNA cytosine methyltransferase [Flavobacteriales bacterium]|nr:DNA cytosine methyltransferase [Flavobacteriales bacterium]